MFGGVLIIDCDSRDKCNQKRSPDTFRYNRFFSVGSIGYKTQKPMQQLTIRFRYECHERTVVLKLSVTKRRTVFVTNKKVLTNELRALNVHIKTCRALKLSRDLFCVVKKRRKKKDKDKK